MYFKKVLEVYTIPVMYSDGQLKCSVVLAKGISKCCYLVYIDSDFYIDIDFCTLDL